ncbi:Copia ltr rider [Phytophthora palmivora]|uniref:Copia ltr rider n=1 Tax=Phytophthora palmivora TaxID=4796 RepID=A0A2P4XDX7_9STRA|nr:Copia ltr rider [Phytophthora palmivora]
MSRDMRLNSLEIELSNRFKMKDLGDISYIFEMEVQHQREQRVMVSQRKYIPELFTQYKMVDSTPVMTQQVPGLALELET